MKEQQMKMGMTENGQTEEPSALQKIGNEYKAQCQFSFCAE